MEKHLHIVSLGIPYPVDYGGVFDLFYKLPALQKQGVQIHLHCFDDGVGEQPELKKYCVTVDYYKRVTGHKSLSTSLPYIVASRRNKTLLDNLLKDDYPIFMEGIHCTFLLNDKRFNNRKKFVRIHNVEYKYYWNLYLSASSILHKLYYRIESSLLKKYEQQIASKATAYWAVTPKDVKVYRTEFGCKKIDYLPVYLPEDWKLNCLQGIGNYCLYHGDLSVDTNEKAAIWLLQKVFSKIKLPLVIAGKNPSKKLIRLAHSQNHTCIVSDPSEREMQDMISKAHINILPSYSNTGIKLKLLNALFNGRHCIANNATVEGSGLDDLCFIVNDAKSFQEKISELNSQPFTCDTIEYRRKILQTIYSNEANAKQQVQWIWGE